MRKQKAPSHAVVFDWDGTITTKRGNYAVLEDAGVLPHPSGRVLELIQKGRIGTLTPEDEREWFKETIENLSANRRTLREAEAALQNLQLRDGVRECLQYLKSVGVPVAIISYGVRDFIEAVLWQKQLCRYVDLVYAAHLEADSEDGEGGVICGLREETAVYPSTKGEWSRAFADLKRVGYGRLLAVGDSGSDRNLGHIKCNRLGIISDAASRQAIAPFFGEVVVSDNFFPVTEWLKEQIESSRKK